MDYSLKKRDLIDQPPDLETMLFQVADCRTVESYQNGGWIPATPIEATWPQLVWHVIWKHREFVADGELAHAKDGTCIIPSKLLQTYHDKAGACAHWRKKKACHRTSLLILDVEDEPIGDSPCDVLDWFRSYFDASTKALIYTSWNHGVRVDEKGDEKWSPGEPRFRIVMPLSRPVHSRDEYPALWRHVYAYLDEIPDSACSDPSRASYTFRDRNPRAELEPWWMEVGSRPLDVDDLPTNETTDSNASSGVGADGSFQDRDSTDKADQRLSVCDLQAAHQQSQQELEQRRQKRLQAVKDGLIDPPSRGQKVTYFRGALRQIAEEVASTPEGGRNDLLLRKATKIGAMLQDLDVDTDKVAEVMVKAGVASGLPTDESKDVVRRAIKYGLTECDPYDWTMQLGTINEGVAVADTTDLGDMESMEVRTVNFTTTEDG